MFKPNLSLVPRFCVRCYKPKSIIDKFVRKRPRREPFLLSNKLNKFLCGCPVQCVTWKVTWKSPRVFNRAISCEVHPMAKLPDFFIFQSQNAGDNRFLAIVFVVVGAAGVTDDRNEK